MQAFPFAFGSADAGAVAGKKRAGYEECTGCNICVLPCTVWKQTSDMSLTLAGRAKALQGGSKAADLAASLESCVLCGACEAVCPVDIDTMGMTLDLRAELIASGASPVFSKAEFLAAAEGAQGIAAAIEAGLPLDSSRLERFLAPLRGKRKIVVPEGILHRHMRGWLPKTQVIGLGESLLLENPALRRRLGPGDLYVIETRGYHADFQRLVRFYDALRVETGCMMNLDLQRAAIPTGALALQRRLGGESVDPQAQARWMLEGRQVKRIVLEDEGDREAFAQFKGLPLLHLSELA